jgi:hypothetical protein
MQPLGLALRVVDSNQQQKRILGAFAEGKDWKNPPKTGSAHTEKNHLQSTYKLVQYVYVQGTGNH